MKHQMTVALLALAVSGGCNGTSVTGSLNSERAAPLSALVAHADQSSARGGDLTVRKECHLYSGQAGEICTITESNLKEIEGSTITYATAAVNGLLDTDVILDPPGPGNNAATGHCSLSLVTGVGSCSFSGGTGRFTWFHATVAVSPLGWPDFAWRGAYSYQK